MGFAQLTHETYKQSGSGSGGLHQPFFNLAIRAEDGSPSKSAIFQGNPAPLNGYYEQGYFLVPFAEAPIITFHLTNAQHNVLCNKTFTGKDGHCPACDMYEMYRQQYGTTDDAKKQYPIKATQQEWIAPFYIPRRGQGRHIRYTQSAAYKTFPLYWMRMRVTSYIPEKRAQLDRLMLADSQAPIIHYPYEIFNVMGKVNDYFFTPTPGSSELAIVDQHPLIQACYTQTSPPQYIAGKEIWDVISHLSLLLFQPFVDPAGNAFDYGGFYPRSVQIWEQARQSWPPASVKVDVPAQAQPAGAILPQQNMAFQGVPSYGVPAQPAVQQPVYQHAPVLPQRAPF